MLNENLAMKFAEKMQEIVKNQSNKPLLSQLNYTHSLPWAQQNPSKRNTQPNQIQNTYLIDESGSSHANNEQMNLSEDEIPSNDKNSEQQCYNPKKQSKSLQKTKQKLSGKKNCKKKSINNSCKKKSPIPKNNKLIDGLNPNNIKSNKRISKPVFSNAEQPPKIIRSKKYQIIEQQDKQQSEYAPINLQVKVPKVKFSSQNQFVEEGTKLKEKSVSNRKRNLPKNKNPIKEESSNENMQQEPNNYELSQSSDNQGKSLKKRSRLNNIQNGDKDKIKRNEVLVKELESIGLNEIQKKEVVHIIERFMFENIGFIAKNIGTLLQSQLAQNSNFRQNSPEEQKQFSLPRKRVKVVQEYVPEVQEEREYSLPRNYPQKSQSAGQKIERRQTNPRIMLNNSRNKLMQKENILKLIEKRVEILQKKHPQEVTQESFKKKIVEEALQIIQKMKVGRELEEEIISQWIDRRKKRDYQRKIVEGRLNGVKKQKMRN